MSFRDDDDELFLSPSDSDAMESHEKAERKARERMAREKGDLFQLQKEILRQQVDVGQMRNAAMQDEETKRSRDAQKKPEHPTGTKTHKQAEKASVLDAMKQFSIDELVQKEHEEEQRQEDQKQEEANDQPG